MRPDRTHAMFAVMCLVWGATWIATKVGVTSVPPSLFAGTRFMVAGAVLLAGLAVKGNLRWVARADVPRFAAITVLLNVATYSLLFWGVKFVGSGLAAILNLALTPVSLLAIGAILGQERLTPARIAGVTLGFVGLCVLFGPKTMSAAGPAGTMTLLGSGAIVLSALVYSWGSVLARPLLDIYSPVLMSGITTFSGGCVLFAGALALEPGAAAALDGRWGWHAWAGWLFLVVFGSLGGYTIFLYLIRAWGAARAGSYAFVSPIIAVLLGTVMLREAVTGAEAIGMIVMLAAAWLTLRPVAAAPADSAQQSPIQPRIVSEHSV